MSGYNANLTESTVLVIDGDTNLLYELHVHVRAAVELMAYSGGTHDGLVQRGGTPGAFPNTQVKLVVAEPAQTLYLNRSSVPVDYSVPLDYYFPLLVRGGTTLTLSLVRGDHTLYYEDIGGGAVQTTLAAFVGEFVQLNFVTTLEENVVERRAGAGTCRDWLFSGFEENVLGTKAEK